MTKLPLPCNVFLIMTLIWNPFRFQSLTCWLRSRFPLVTRAFIFKGHLQTLEMWRLSFLPGNLIIICRSSYILPTFLTWNTCPKLLSQFPFRKPVFRVCKTDVMQFQFRCVIRSFFLIRAVFNLEFHSSSFLWSFAGRYSVWQQIVYFLKAAPPAGSYYQVSSL